MTDNHVTGTIVCKSGKYYICVYYYKNGKRHTKSYPTGIDVDENNQRKAAQNKRAARKMLADIIRSFEVPASDPPRLFHQINCFPMPSENGSTNNHP